MSIEVIPEKPIPSTIQLRTSDTTWSAKDMGDFIQISQYSASTYTILGPSRVTLPKSEFKEFMNAIQKEFINAK